MSGPGPSPFLTEAPGFTEASDSRAALRLEPEFLAPLDGEVPELIVPDGGEVALFASEGEQGMEAGEGLSIAAAELGETPSPFVSPEESSEESFTQPLGLSESEHEQSRIEEADRVAEAG